MNNKLENLKEQREKIWQSVKYLHNTRDGSLQRALFEKGYYEIEERIKEEIEKMQGV